MRYRLFKLISGIALTTFLWQDTGRTQLNYLRPVSTIERESEFVKSYRVLANRARNELILKAIEEMAVMVNQEGSPLNLALQQPNVQIRRLNLTTGQPEVVTMSPHEIIRINLEAIRKTATGTLAAGDDIRLNTCAKSIRNALILAAKAVSKEAQTEVLETQFSKAFGEVSDLTRGLRLVVYSCAVLRNNQCFKGEDFEAEVINFVKDPKRDFDESRHIAVAALIQKGTVGGLVTLLSKETLSPLRAEQVVELDDALKVNLADARMLWGKEPFLQRANFDLFKRFLEAGEEQDLSGIYNVLNVFMKGGMLAFAIVDEATSGKMASKIIKLSRQTNDFMNLDSLAILLVGVSPEAAVAIIRGGDPANFVYFVFMNLYESLRAGRYVGAPELAAEIDRALRARLDASRRPPMTKAYLKRRAKEPQQEKWRKLLEKIRSGILSPDQTMIKVFEEYYPTSQWYRLEGVVTRVIECMSRLRRDYFLPTFVGDWTYEDRPLEIPMGHGQTISQPYVVMRTTVAVDPKPGEKVLEIGTGSGYQAAIFSEMVGRTGKVHTIEVHEDLANNAETTCRNLGLGNIIFYKGQDGSGGLEKEAPFDIIVVTAGAPEIPDVLCRQLKEHGGRLIIPVKSQDNLGYDSVLVRRWREAFARLVVMPGTLWVPLVGKYGYHIEGLPESMPLGPPVPMQANHLVEEAI